MIKRQTIHNIFFLLFLSFLSFVAVWLYNRYTKATEMRALCSLLIEETVQTRENAKNSNAIFSNKAEFIENISRLLGEGTASNVFTKREPDLPFSADIHTLYSLRKPTKIVYNSLKELMVYLTAGIAERPQVWVLSLVLNNADYDGQSVSLEKLEFIVRDFP